MTIGACLVFPSIPPVSSSADDDNRRVPDRRLSGGHFDQHTAIIASTQLVQAELAGSKVIKPRFEIAEGTTGEVEFNLIESAGARRRAKVNLTTGIGATADDARRE